MKDLIKQVYNNFNGDKKEIKKEPSLAFEMEWKRIQELQNKSK